MQLSGNSQVTVRIGPAQPVLIKDDARYWLTLDVIGPIPASDDAPLSVWQAPVWHPIVRVHDENVYEPGDLPARVSWLKERSLSLLTASVL